MSEKKNGPDLHAKMEGIMEYYVIQYFDYYTPKMKKQLRTLNVHMDPELADTFVDQLIGELKQEISSKFNDIALLLLDNVISGNLIEVRMFEERFIDLLERTLLKDLKAEPAQVTIVIPDLAEQTPKEE